MKNTLYKLS